MENAQAAMPRYQSHKKVFALKIREVVAHAHPDPEHDSAVFEASDEFQGGHLFPENEAYAPIPVDADWYRRHQPKAGGYYVVYEDGYRSYSPAEAFESGYKLVEANGQPTIYTASKKVTEQIDKAFVYHAPKSDQASRYTSLRQTAKVLAEEIALLTPPSREQSVALTKLEECVMWANASIARNE